jgi:hypothetical protein
VNDATYQRIVEARKAGRNPDDHDSAITTQVLAAIAALQTKVLAQHEQITQLQAAVERLQQARVEPAQATQEEATP